jgi:hypothetical protein
MGQLSTPAATVPNDVAQLAAQRGFGNLLDIRREVPLSAALIRGWGIAAVSFALMLLVAWLGQDTSVFSLARSILRLFVLFFFFLFVWGLVYGIRGLVVGSRVHYLYEGGLVHSRRSGLRAVTWPEVTVLKSVYNRRSQGGEGKVLGYRVETQGGTAFTIPLALVDGRDTFIDRIVERLRAHGRPIQ